MPKIAKNVIRKKRAFRIRKKISGTTERPRLTVYRSNKHFSAQIIDDIQWRTAQENTSIDYSKAGDLLKQYFEPTEETETNWQLISAALAIVSPFQVITGGPGTGKTTTVSKIMATLLELDPNCSSC